MKQVWITARAPSKEDADEQRHVLTPHSTRASGYRFKRWDHVPKGDPWHPTLVMPPYVPEKTPEKTPEEIRDERIASALSRLPDDYVLLGMRGDFKPLPVRRGSWPAVGFWLEDRDYIGIWESGMHDGSFDNVLYAAPEGSEIVALQEQKYWSKPSHFPPVCWLRRGDSLSSSLVVNVSVRHCTALLSAAKGFVKVDHSDLELFRWSDRPFDKFEDGKECLVENSDE